MRDKTESIIVLATLVVAGVSAILADFTAINLSVVGWASFFLLWGYSIYWAFNLRHHLSAPQYRNQALGVGLVAIGFGAFDYSFLVSSSSLPDIAFTLALLLTFYWLDASIIVGRKSDPLFRNTFHWRQLRLAIWLLLFLVVAVDYVGILFDPSSFLILVPSGISQNPSPLALAIVSIVFLAVFLPGPITLLMTAFRSKDTKLRRHLQWFGLFAGSLALFLPASIASGQPIFIAAGYLLATYSLYRSAKSLAPLNLLPVQFSQPLGR